MSLMNPKGALPRDAMSPAIAGDVGIGWPEAQNPWKQCSSRKILSLLFATLASLVAVVASCEGQQPLLITFDGPPPQPPGTAFLIDRYDEGGMVFTPISGSVGFGRIGISPVSFRPDNGTAYLQAALGETLAFQFSIGSPLRLLSVDLAEYSTVVPDAVTLHFIGYRMDGSIVTQDFTTDGIIDGTGPIRDFQTFYFGPEFSGLSRVEIPTFGWSLDNLVLVPEPGAWGLILLGSLTATILFRSQRRRQ